MLPSIRRPIAQKINLTVRYRFVVYFRDDYAGRTGRPFVRLELRGREGQLGAHGGVTLTNP